jgi:hypothetical protein
MHHCAVCAIAPDREVARCVVAGQVEIDCLRAVCDGERSPIATGPVPVHRRRVSAAAGERDMGKVERVRWAEISDHAFEPVAGLVEQQPGGRLQNQIHSCWNDRALVQQQLPAHEVCCSLQRSAGRNSGACGETPVVRIVDRQSADRAAGLDVELAAAVERYVARAAARTGDDVRAALDRDAASPAGAAGREQQCTGLHQSASGISVGAGELDRAACGRVDHDAAGAGREIQRGRIAVLVGDDIGVVCSAAAPNVTVWLPCRKMPVPKASPKLATLPPESEPPSIVNVAPCWTKISPPAAKP